MSRDRPAFGQITLPIYILKHFGSKGWLGFPDLWSRQKPWWNWYLTPMVNFGEVRRVQLAKSTLSSPPCWCTWDLLRSFKVCSHVKERVGCGKQREAPAPIHPSKTVTWDSWICSGGPASELNCDLGSWVCSEGPALGHNSLMNEWWCD